MNSRHKYSLAKRILAGVTALSIIGTAIALDRSAPVYTDSDNAIVPAAEKTSAPEETGTASSDEPAEEPAQEEAQNIDNSKKDNALLTEDKVDFQKIVEEAKDEEFRQQAEISRNTVVVARSETSETQKIEDTEWFKEGFVECDVLMKRDCGDSKLVYYELKTNNDIWESVDKLNGLDEVTAAEPVYIYHTSAEGVPTAANNSGMASQWYLDDQDISTVWDSELYGDTSGEGAVVAVIDTGVDYTHEDLKDNIWMNSAELFGQDGVDDDGNGYVDDVNGFSFISNSPDPMDDNGHGTHVAGIIAMADNKTGGVGLAYKSKIMAIKAGQSDGSLASTDIAKAIDYAAGNGADVINMSFGSYAHSAIIESALQDAFASCVLVAAAGNDSYPTLDAVEYVKRGNMYPAAYSYVIGVMAYNSQNQLTDFSNWDYKPNYGAEYEIAAPGYSIYSTLPGNRYASWSGTSMAAPAVAAAAAILRSSHPDKLEYSSRYIMGQIVGASTQTLSFTHIFSKKPLVYNKLCLKDSLLKSPKPNISVNEVYVFDSPEYSSKNNGDGIVQPGETIALAVGLRNQWGAATDVKITCNASPNGVPNPYAEFLNGNVYPINDIGTFGTQDNGFIYDDEGIIKGVDTTLLVKIAENTPNDAHIQFNINYLAKNALDKSDKTVYSLALDSKLSISVQSGKVLKGKIASDMTLTPENYYIIENSLLIPRGVTVNVEPGTQIQFWSGDSAGVNSSPNIAFIQVEGKMNFNGTQEAPIKLFPGKNYEAFRVEVRYEGTGTVNMDYVDIINPELNITRGSHIKAQQDYDSVNYRYYSESNVYTSSGSTTVRASEGFSNSIFTNFRFSYFNGKYDTVLFDGCGSRFDSIEAKNCTFLVNQSTYEDFYSGTLQHYTASMNYVGQVYMLPSYDTVSSVYTLNGKKYAAYRFTNFYFPDYDYESGNNYPTYFFKENFKAMRDAFANNKGKLLTIDLSDYPDNEESAMLKQLAKEVLDNCGYNYNNAIYFATDFYCDSYSSGFVDSEGNAMRSYGSSPTSPFMWYGFTNNYSMYTDETGKEIVDTYMSFWPTNWDSFNSNGYSSNCYIIAEYDESVPDYNILNPVFDTNSLGGLQNTKFTSNAVLNRLASKDTNDWMKLNAGTNRNGLYVISDNYWGTTDPEIIQKQLIDFDTNIMFGDYITDPILTAPAESTYPCVADLYLTDKNGERVRNVGSGEYDVHVVFNRDMDTSVDPMVTYGPDDPYTDYRVSGSWISSREWSGKTTIKVLINQGSQYFRVKNAAAASDPWLVTGTDWGRFTFNIQASGTEALTLQGEGKKGEIFLNWMQDDYDTLAGYNIYRSETGDEGSFYKVNSSIVSLDTKEYSDKQVQSGVKYYYYFTVVDTDFKESKPSNIVSAASIDDKAPTIDHNPAGTLSSGINAMITANVFDNIGVASVSLFYRIKSSGDFTEIMMNKSNDRSYNAQIPAKTMVRGTLEYYIKATDKSGNTEYYGTANKPVSVIVEDIPAITSVTNASGKVGDTMKPVIYGMNLTPDLELYIDSDKVEYTFVSDKELDVVGYQPKFMGKKSILLLDEGETAASYVNALTVTDDSIYVRNDSALMLKQSADWQYVYYSTNFTGKLSTYEVTFRRPDSYNEIYESDTYTYCYGTMIDGDYNEADRTNTFKMKFNSNCGAGDLFGIGFYNIKTKFVPEIVSVKINGVEVKNVSTDPDRLTFIDEQLYVPIESITVLNDTSVQYNIGDKIKIEYLVEPVNSTMKKSINIRYNSDLVRENDDGTFTAIGSGYAYFEITSPTAGNYVELYIKPEDMQAPNINPTNTLNEYASDCDTAITADITDENEIKSAVLFYRTSASGKFTETAMKKTSTGEYKAIIPAAAMKEGSLEYYITASDGKNTGSSGTAENPHTANIVKMIAVTSVTNASGKVGDTMKPVIHGINFTRDLELYIDSDKVEYTLVSDKELDVVGYQPKNMGKKSVIIIKNDETLTSMTDAVSVSDDSIYVRNESAKLLTDTDETQYVYYSTNYSGWINTLEVSFKVPTYTSGEQASYGLSVFSGYCETSYTDDETGIITYLFRSRYSINSGDNIFYFNFYGLTGKIQLNITSVKINGLEVADVKYDASKTTYMSAAQIVPLEAIYAKTTDTYYAEIGDVIKAEYSVYPANATIRSAVTYSYDSSLLKYNGDGTFTAIRSGGTSIGFCVDGEWSRTSMYVQIKPLPVTAITAKQTGFRGSVGSKLNIEISAEPLESDAELNWFHYTGEGADIIKNENRGRNISVLLTKEGSVTLRAYFEDSDKTFIDINIEIMSNDTYADITEDLIVLAPKDVYTLNASVGNNPGDGTVDLHFSGSNNKIVKVSGDGKITAVSDGCAVVTADVDGGGKSDSVIVLVVSGKTNAALGDVNMDGEITAVDAMLALKLALYEDCPAAAVKLADVNGDGRVTSSDAMLILKYVTGAIAGF